MTVWREAGQLEKPLAAVTRWEDSPAAATLTGLKKRPSPACKCFCGTVIICLHVVNVGRQQSQKGARVGREHTMQPWKTQIRALMPHLTSGWLWTHRVHLCPQRAGQLWVWICSPPALIPSCSNLIPLPCFYLLYVSFPHFIEHFFLFHRFHLIIGSLLHS